jgi:hypothetical protein
MKVEQKAYRGPTGSLNGAGSMRKKRDTQTLAYLLTAIDLAEYFERVSQSKWTCIKQIGFATQRGQVLIAPGTTFTRGTCFTGMDMAFLLDNEYERRNGREW